MIQTTSPVVRAELNSVTVDSVEEEHNLFKRIANESLILNHTFDQIMGSK